MVRQLAPDIPTYVMKDCRTGTLRTIHRNRLLLMVPAEERGVALCPGARAAQPVSKENLPEAFSGPPSDDRCKQQESEDILEYTRLQMGQLPTGWVNGRLRALPWTCGKASECNKGDQQQLDPE